MNRVALLATTAALVATAALPSYAEDAIVKDETTVTMSDPSAPVVPFGGKSVVTGTVSGVLDRLSSQEGRPVSLELKTPHGWMPLRSADPTDATGDYSVRVPTSWYYRGTIRTTVPESETHEAGVSETTSTVTVKPPYSPDGRASSWSHLFDDQAARWNPCEVITFRVNDKGGPARAVRQVKQAMRKLAAATGLRFKYDGATNAIPFRTDGRKPASSGAALTIAWATPEQVRPLRGGTIGWGGGAYRDGEIFVGGIALDRTGTSGLADGFGKGATWGAVLLHELGHVMGLGHVDDTSQLMYPAIQRSTRGRYEAGDLAGLRDQGAMGGCVVGTAERLPSAPHHFATS